MSIYHLQNAWRYSNHKNVKKKSFSCTSLDMFHEMFFLFYSD